MFELEFAMSHLARLQASVNGSLAVNGANVEIIEIIVEHPLGADQCPLHSHTWFEFNYICEGTMQSSFGGPMIEVGPGSFFLIPPGMVHSHCYVPEAPHWGICIRWTLAGDAPDGAREERGDKQDAFAQLERLRGWNPGCYKDDMGIGLLLLRMFQEASREHSQLSLQLTLLQLLLALAGVGEPQEHVPTSSDYSNAALLRKIEIYLNDDQRRKINVHELAASLHMSYGNLARKYKQLTGQTIMDRMLSIRLERSKEMLLSTDNRIQDISKIAGFSNLYYFSRVFKESFGISPSKYRAAHTARK
ncbi:AraC family transcriptional regulator [Paenibacillus nasutitermitis]|uniref:HTH araC/xylS-type domain-containing protein n=1 Tax=Paenibacillus nasutitermitis TaxID=1652958 RepID=A0A916Z5C9_9BACL|nr:helix-turn-helix domain-containing protein [Paenibacillus nasutitermitis]GGD77546.1 hypothetical protein GCM10010911_39480 [Paenibacillus nasutitermitis]